MLGVVTPEFESSAAAAGDRNPAKPACNDPSLHFDRALTVAELFARRGRSRAAEFEPALPAAIQKTLPGLEEALKVSADGVMGVFVCGSGPGVGILSRQNPDAAIRAIRQCFLENGVGATRKTSCGPGRVRPLSPSPRGRVSGSRLGLLPAIPPEVGVCSREK